MSVDAAPVTSSAPVASPPPALVRGTLDGADCVNCPFARDGQAANPVRGIGPANPMMIFVAESPGINEVRQGAPLVGPTGELLNRALAETGTDRSKIWLTNAVLCLPPPKSDPKIRKQAARACRGRLERELMERPDIPLLALGDVAVSVLLEDATKLPITKIAGAHFDHDVDGSGVRPVIATVHPAAILRASGDGDKGPEKTGSHVADLAFWSLKWDILKVKAFAEGKDIRLRMRVGEELHIELKDPERARNLVWERICVARETGRLTIDYETYVDDDQRNFALQAFVAKIRLLSLANGGQACCVLWDLLDPVMIDEYAKVLADPAITKGWHNGEVYDAAVSENQWYRFKVAGPTEDTLLGQHVAWPGAKKTLQHVACQYRAIAPWKSEHRDSGDSLEDEAIYSAKDALSTDASIAPTKFWIKKHGVDRVYEIDKIKGAFARKMHLKGYFVDPDVNTEIKRRLKTVIDEANAFMISRYDEVRDRVWAKLAAERAKTARKSDPDHYADRIRVREAELAKEIEKDKFEFSPSNDWHAAAFLKAVGVPLWATTKGGRTATGAAVLEKFSQYPEVDELLRLRSNEQLYETFVVRMFEWTRDSQDKWRAPHVQDDGRVHPIWKPTQISGRFGSDNPASSNWSMGDETNQDPRRRLPNIRRQMVAPPGRAIVGFDKCLAKGTLVETPRGHVPIEALDVGELVFSFNPETDRPTCSRVTAKKYTGMRSTLVVVLDNGERVRCTPDHRWVDQRGAYVYARDLKPDDRLMPFRRLFRRDGYELLYARSSFEYTLAHRAIVEGQLGRVLRRDEHVHHLDENPSNNAPSNLALKPRREHVGDHARVNTKAQWRVPAIRRKMSAGISESIKRRGGYHGENNPNFGKRTGLETTCPQCGAPTYLGGKHPKLFCNRTCASAWEKGKPRGARPGLNHRVVEIIDDGLVVPTWDIEVERDHTFALAAGVFVHNSQLEARSIAVQSGDPFLCSIFRDGKDIHHEFGVIAFPSMAFLDKSFEEYNHLRDTTKRVEYGAIYGGADATVHKAIAAEVPSLAGPQGFKMVREAIATMKRAIPGVFAWQQRLLRETSQPPYTLTSYLLKRRRVFPLGNPPPTDIANNPNQFFGADVMDLGLVEIMKRLEHYDDAFPIAHQHDAIYFECWEDDAMRLAKDVDEAFYTEVTAVNGDVIAFPNEIKIGFAYHSEPSDKQKGKFPQLVWPCGRPGLKKIKVK